MPPIIAMNVAERRATYGIAAIYGLRMLGLFLILPTFSIYAMGLIDKPDPLMIGLALGAYGLTQALLHIPLGIISDRLGRKLLIYIGLVIFSLGSFVAAQSVSIVPIILGRTLQGAGAISAVLTALLADTTREQVRTRAMAGIGLTIGMTFILSLILGPILSAYIGINGIFYLMGVLALLAIPVVYYVIPTPIGPTQAPCGFMSMLRNVLCDSTLLRLNYGVFALHATQMSFFFLVPLSIQTHMNLPATMHWKIYLFALLASLPIVIPTLMYVEKRTILVLKSAILLMLITQIGLGTLHSTWGIFMTLTSYFIAFNILETLLPSLISKTAPSTTRGTAMGVYNTAQSLGIFVGGSMGGYIYKHGSPLMVFIFCGVMMTLWLLSVSHSATKFEGGNRNAVA